MTDFIDWQGGSCPVPLYSFVNIRVREKEYNDDNNQFHAGELSWDWDDSDPDFDIVSYRLVEPQPTFIEWNGGENPAPGKLVEYAMRDSYQFYITESENLDWSHNPVFPDSDVVSYRIY